MYHVNAQGVDERIVNKCTLLLLFRYATLASIPTCKPRLKTEDQLLETCNQSAVSVISDDVVTRKVRVPGEIKRSRDLRGGRWSWTLTFAQKRS